jgi:hypothetical protein
LLGKLKRLTGTLPRYKIDILNHHAVFKVGRVDGLSAVLFKPCLRALWLFSVCHCLRPCFEFATPKTARGVQDNVLDFGWLFNSWPTPWTPFGLPILPILPDSWGRWFVGSGPLDVADVDYDPGVTTPEWHGLIPLVIARHAFDGDPAADT